MKLVFSSTISFATSHGRLCFRPLSTQLQLIFIHLHTHTHIYILLTVKQHGGVLAVVCVLFFVFINHLSHKLSTHTWFLFCQCFPALVSDLERHHKEKKIQSFIEKYLGKTRQLQRQLLALKCAWVCACGTIATRCLSWSVQRCIRALKAGHPYNRWLSVSCLSENFVCLNAVSE